LPPGSEFGLESLYELGKLAVENGWKFDELREVLAQTKDNTNRC